MGLTACQAQTRRPDEHDGSEEVAMTELEEIKEKLAPGARRILDAAIEESKTRQHYYLGVEHLFLSFAKVEEVFFREVMEDLNLDVYHVLNFLNEHLNVSRQYIGL